ncbi:LacI family DNA-binding transcriptional regulator [Hymenobacter sp. M29]|uniref:LacI family DNA-binding transcriptional regulator n=1 Tax=Hymenobacter mellowenesis TaxID=3063995 RepID=A0ABT9AF36_9BACT|nr:LacI family DNA-binding transcriptional regulator [Hymenobacter sp. M29]MDO7848474.1 LacI family DNA-binding transcriptional regulator [Hymenobacter sp. M29]
MDTRKKQPTNAVAMADLARTLGVSMTTVSRALSNHHSIGAATKQRVLQLAKKLNYQPNHLASALRKGHSRLLGVVVPYIEGQFLPSVIQGIEQAASKAGFSVIVCQSHENVDAERRNVETLLHAQVAGVLVSLARNTQDFHHFERVRKRGIPLVFFDRAPIAEAVNSVVLNDYEGLSKLPATCWSRAVTALRIWPGRSTYAFTRSAVRGISMPLPQREWLSCRNYSLIPT